MSSQTKVFVSPVDYLAAERRSESRSEYYKGEVFAMTGASANHNLITLNIGSELRIQLKGRDCRVFANDLRVKIQATGLYTYPDVVATCGKLQFEDKYSDTLLNPVLIVEVLSKSTYNYDRSTKFFG